MELFNNSNPYYEKWKPGRPSKAAIEKRAKYWQWEKIENSKIDWTKNQFLITKII